MNLIQIVCDADLSVTNEGFERLRQSVTLVRCLELYENNEEE